MSTRFHPQDSIPVFHPDHPHNKRAHHFQQAYQEHHQPQQATYPLASSHLNLPLRLPSPLANKSTVMAMKYDVDSGMSDSERSASSSPSHGRRRCFCGREVDVVEGERGIYCSINCARSDAFSSLCYKPGAPSSAQCSTQIPSLASAISASLSRTPSLASPSASTSALAASTSYDGAEWNASHYRRLARADLRREERREERRRRRAEGSSASTASRNTVMSSLSTSSSRVPDLVGGHSRNASTASTASSVWSGSALSRNPSSASSASMSSRRGHGGVNVDTVILEDEDEEEWLQDTRPYAPPPKMGHGHKRRPSASQAKRKLEPLGMGKDMRDVLEEIIQMEKGFVVDDPDGDGDHCPGPFTAAFDRPLRTPSPAPTETKRMSIVPEAPGAPARTRGHRPTLSIPLASPRTGGPQRPPSMTGLHQSSLSESHTALYLATASPVHAGRRSASPKLQSRQSLTFTPETAGPSILGLPLPSSSRFDSPGGSLTPNRRRLNTSPAHHPTMDHWRFPSSASGSATPTRPVLLPINTAPLMAETTTPVNRRQSTLTSTTNQPSTSAPTMAERIQPHLLWPPPPNLAPSLFPTSPATGTPEFVAAAHPEHFGRHRTRSSPGEQTSPESMIPPHSGLRLGVLLGIGDVAEREGEGDDVDMDVDVDEDRPTAHGHGLGLGPGGEHGRGTYLPVFLEAEGFRSANAAQWFA